MAVSDLVFIDSAGYHFADFPSFLAYIQTGMQGIFGADIYLGSDSQDGQLSALFAQACFDTASIGASVYNSFSPATAQGVGLSRVVKINGISREIPTNSTVILTLVGVAGTTITNGIAVDTLQQQWLLPVSVTIPNTGTIDVTATAAVVGAVAAAASTVNGIFTPTLGWQTVSNTAAAISGAPTESDAQLRIRQGQSTSLPALTVLDATVAALENLVGVTQVAPYENVTETTDSNGLTAHSVCFVVQGGAIDDITNAIGLYKTPGTTTFASGANARNEIYTDPKGLPVPINFINPAINATITAELTVTPLTGGWTTDFVPLIQAAIAAAINAIPIGGLIIPSNLYVAAALVGTPAFGTFYVVNNTIEIQKNSGGFGTSNIQLAFDEIPVAVASGVNVTVT